jgi:hypothetical protein
MNGVSLPWASSPRLGLIGNPENRRVRDFQEIAVALGAAKPECLSYERLLEDPASLDRFEADLLRIESPGENSAVADALIHLGGGPARSGLVHGQIGFQREYHRGFCQVLDRIQSRGIPALNAPGDIAVMFDKWESHQRFAANGGVARPHSEMAPGDFGTLHSRMRELGHGRWFLKPLHGSSASGVCALRWTGDRRSLTAPLRIDAAEGGEPILVNSLDVRTYTSLADIELIFGLLLPEGMILEEWIPKLTLPDGAVDLRVLVIDGEARHWVVRQSRHPMTNLHLGNRRGDESEFIEAIGPERLSAAFQLAEQAAGCFPESLSCGVDVLLDARHRPFVGEINAFGDLLPRLTHRGDSAYAAIFKAAHASHARRCLV